MSDNDFQVEDRQGDLASMFLKEIQEESAAAAPAAPEPTTAPVEVEAEAPDEVPETEAEQVEEAATQEQGDEAEAPIDLSAIQAPSGMSDADKAEFAKLPEPMRQWLNKTATAATADYTRKSQEIAEKRKRYDAALDTVTHRLSALDQTLESIVGNRIEPPDPGLRLTDPEAYDAALANYNYSRHAQEVAEKKRAEVQKELEAVYQHRTQQFLAEQDQILREAAPELYTEKGPAIRRQIAEFAMKTGYSKQELDAASAKDVLTLWKAQQFDALQAAKKAVKPVAQAAPKTVKPGPAKAVGRPTQIVSAIKNFDASPSRSTLADMYLAEIQSERR